MAKKHSEEDVIRPILLVRYVTMSGEEALWPIKLTPPDSKANSWNTSALNIVEIAASGKWDPCASSMWCPTASSSPWNAISRARSNREGTGCVNPACKEHTGDRDRDLLENKVVELGIVDRASDST